MKIYSDKYLFINTDGVWSSYEACIDIEGNKYYALESNPIYSKELKSVLDSLINNDVKVVEKV